MTISEVKNDLHRLVVETDDANVLQRIMTIFIALREGKEDGDWWDVISDQEKMLINKGLQQLAQGQRVPHSVVRQEINQLLGRQSPNA